MSRDVTLEHGHFIVSDDPEQVIGTVLNLVVNNVNRAHIAELLAPEGDGAHLDTFGTVTRVETRDDLPEPWDEDPALDPETTELWALYRDHRRGEAHYRRTYVLTGDELRELAARAALLIDAYYRG